MTITDILNKTEHRPWKIPVESWSYYQEWNQAIFLHWEVETTELERFVPSDLEIDLYDGKPWVSIVAFTMERIRPKYLPSFSPISHFEEINIRTYVKSDGKPGVYFLSIEGGKSLSCTLAKVLSELPYRYSSMRRFENRYESSNLEFGDRLHIEFDPGQAILHPTHKDKWLTERYALVQDTPTSINEFEIHHQEWPIYEIRINKLEVDYPRFNALLTGQPHLTHYSTGVQVIAWGKHKKVKLQKV